MKKSLLALPIVILGSLFILGLLGQAQALADDPPRAKTATPVKVELALYKPPMLGAPRLRVGGGVRGAEDNDAPVLQVLAPLQCGLTTRKQPILYWHLDKPAQHALEITVMEVGGVSPLARELQVGPIAAGLHAFRLAGQDKSLGIGKEYEWFVAVILDPAQRSKDIIASGGLRRIAMPDGLQGQLNTAQVGEDGLLYAGAGLWYDAIDALVEGLGKTADKATLSGQFSAILKQEEIIGISLTVPMDKL